MQSRNVSNSPTVCSRSRAGYWTKQCWPLSVASIVFEKIKSKVNVDKGTLRIVNRTVPPRSRGGSKRVLERQKGLRIERVAEGTFRLSYWLLYCWLYKVKNSPSRKLPTSTESSDSKGDWDWTPFLPTPELPKTSNVDIDISMLIYVFRIWKRRLVSFMILVLLFPFCWRRPWDSTSRWALLLAIVINSGTPLHVRVLISFPILHQLKMFCLCSYVLCGGWSLRRQFCCRSCPLPSFYHELLSFAMRPASPMPTVQLLCFLNFPSPSKTML